MKTTTFATAAAGLLSHAYAQQFVMYTRGGDDTSVQRADPILAPGTISQHVHQIFGADGFAPEVTYDSLQDSSCTTVGDASGNGNGADNSIYWHPALFMEAKDGSGYIRVPTLGHKFYYKNAGTGTMRSPFEFPQGFRMLAGNAMMRAAVTDAQQQNITQWVCHDSSGNNQGTAGGFPTGVTDCDAYPGFNGALHFPHCWNGNEEFNLESPNVVYPTGDIENGECPSSHPTRLPHIFAENQFDLHSVVDKVKPDTFVLAMGDNTGYGWHADFFNGWKDGAIPALLDTCPQGEYGNEDIGSCPSFEKSSVSVNDCTLKTTYVEKVTTPGQNLPGCNPIQDTNPALLYKTAPLGTYSDQCQVLGGGPAPQPPSSSKPTASSKPSGTTMSGPSDAPTSSSKTVPPSSTMATTTKVSKPTHTLPSGGHGHGSGASAMSCPGSNKKTYTIHGMAFKVQCGVDHSGGNLKSISANSLGECAAACAKTDGCVDVSLRGTACYMKSSLGSRVKDSGVNGAKLVDSSTAGTVTTMGGYGNKRAVPTAIADVQGHVARHVHHLNAHHHAR